ncbi:MAG: ABC transporter ATP-binding protein [Candidatus Hydrothermales bacterium]
MENVIYVENLTKYFTIGFKRKKILNSISFKVKKGEIVGFLGPNGAGKTTTIKILTNLLNFDEGNVKIFGLNPGVEDVSRKTGFLPEQPYFYDHLSGYEFLEFTGELYGIEKRKLKEKIEYLLEKVGLKEHGKKSIRTYSRGMLQRIGIANVLIRDPELLILDEPLTGLDPIGRKEIKDLIYEQKLSGKTVFLSSHILSDAEELCDRVILIFNGTIVKEGTLEEILRERIKSYEIVLKNSFDEKFGDFNIERRRDEYIIKVSESEIEDVLKKIFQSGKKVKIIRISPLVYTLEEWFVETLKKK